MSALDPRLWLFLIALSATAYLSGDYSASSKYKAKEAALIAAAKAKEDAANTAAKEKLDDATERVRETERFMSQTIASIADQNKKVLQNEIIKRTRFIADVRSGAVKLSIPVIAGRADTASADAAPASGNRYQTRAELTPEAGITLAAIADDGDDAIRQLNSCIDAYAAVRAANVQAQ